MSMLARLATMGGAAAQTYIDDVFSAFTYTGNGSTQTITNGIDLSAKGGLVWIKSRGAAYNNFLVDSARGVSNRLQTNSTNGSAAPASAVTAFNSDGFSLGADVAGGDVNLDAVTRVAWTFRQSDKFFGVATVTKSSGSNATANFANLGTLGMVVVKRTDSTGSWYVWHRSLTAGKLLYLEQTAAEATLGHITVSGTTVTLVNGTITDGSYVVYAWAHDTAASGLVQCGSFTTDGSGKATVTLGWEPQFVLTKVPGSVSDWWIRDTSRGMASTATAQLYANKSDAEYSYASSIDGAAIIPNATGFNANLSISTTYIYLAIRRPNKPPTSGTQVYNAIARTGTSAAATVTGVGFPVDLFISARRSATGTGARLEDRLRGATRELDSGATSAESAVAQSVTSFASMDGASIGTDGDWNTNTATYIDWFFRRAPGVFDITCTTGTSATNKRIPHNLGVAPELIIVKDRSGYQADWQVYCAGLGSSYTLRFNGIVGKISASFWGSPVASTTDWGVNETTGDIIYPSATNNYVAYLFATLAGVSKVFSYTGNGTNQNIECGFSAGARFVLIKRTDSTGNWLVADTVRGIVSGNDPSLALNSTAAEVTSLDWIDPYAGGFNVVQESTNNANVNNATYIGLAFS